MAVLRREPELFPQNLFDLGEEEHPWWVARVRSRREKVLARHLLPGGVPFYLPQIENRVRGGGPGRVSHLPLFPGYVFFRGDRGARLMALQSQVVTEILTVFDQSLLASELRQLRRLQESGASIVPLAAFSAGDAVVVADGPFRGYAGTIVREMGRDRLIVSVSLLRKAVAVEFRTEALAPDRRFRRSPALASAGSAASE
jgi:transcription antitermination factor NusG